MDFVTYEQAILLKKLGFEEKCLAYYTADHVLITAHNYYSRNKTEFWSKYIVDAPTITQVCEWLFNKGFFVEVNWFCTDKENRWWFNIVNLKSQSCYTDSKDYDSPKITLLEGITKCLKFLE